jgi:hypothetical protein
MLRNFSMQSIKASYEHFSQSVVKTVLFILLLGAVMPVLASDLVITGVVDGPLTGGVPKAVEVYVVNNVADLSIYGLGSANNGGGTDGQEFTFPAGGAAAGQFIYVTSQAAGFTTFFGFDADYVSNMASINGDDAIELFHNGFVVDIFGDINVDGNGEPWEYLDGWAYRNDNTGPDCTTFVLANWSFSGPNALDGETTNDTAATPFPIGEFVTTWTDSAPCVLSTSPADGAAGVAVDANILIDFDEDVSTTGSWFDISCTSSGAHPVTVSGGPQSFTLDPDFDFDGSETCTVTLSASQITDVDVDDPPDNLAADHVFSFDTVSAIPPDWVINEIHADPHSAEGDANGDGTPHFGQDEFVEIVNTSGAPMDISGWTLADGFGVRHTFPGGTVVPDQCSIVVFGGGAPTGDFGGSSVQTASTGALGFNNGGDDITLNDGSIDAAMASYTGSEGGNDQSITLSPDVTGALPFVQHTVAPGSGGTRFSPGTRADGVAFDGCPPVPPAWVINELLADPASGDAGDANGDGTRQSSEDEFIEIINNSASAKDISGWTLSDNSGLRHTFPAGTVVFPNCGVLVFGGGSPTGFFGGMLVQNSSVGFLGLNNSGDTMTLNSGIGDAAVASYTGSEGGDNQSITLDPDVVGALPWVKHSLAAGSGGTLFSPGTLINGSAFAGCPRLLEIHEIQGSGGSSPFEGSPVITNDNVVTAIDTDGFFIQTPDERVDGDPETSQGIFVFTVSAPTVVEGDRVDVEGTIAEFFSFTEIGSVTSVVVVSAGNPVPAPVVFDASTPGPAPSPQEAQLERFESMLVSFVGMATAPSDRFGDVPVVTQPVRSFREPGVEFPGLFLPPIPTWDGNPEVFDVDPDGLGGADAEIFANQMVEAEGPLGFSFGDYQVLPKVLTLGPVPDLPIPVRLRNPGELTVGSLNMFRFFIDAADVDTRLAKFVSHILDVLNAPDILAVQEVGTIEALQVLAADISAVDPAVNYTAYLVEGNDIGGIDVGFLVRQHIQVNAVTQLGAAETYIDPTDGSVDILHDRPPLLLEATCPLPFGNYPISVMVVHNRSLGSIEDPVDGERVRFKRLSQAESIAMKVQDLQTLDPDVRLVVLGDFNAFEFTDGYVDAVAVIAGDFDPDTSLVCYEASCAADLVEPNLDNQVLGLDASERYSFIFGGNAQLLDHALTSQKLSTEVSGAEFGRGNADVPASLIADDGSIVPGNLPLRSSDHDGMVVFIAKDEDADGVPNDLDVCPGTVAPEPNVPTNGTLGSNRWALLDDEDPLVFDQALPQGGSHASYTLGDTAGCSCEQIIDAQGLGSGHTKSGCSNGEMEAWVELVTQP